MTASRRRATLRESFLAALPAWLVARACVLGALVLARFLFDQMGDPASRPSQLDAGLLGWDAGWYRQIADEGYDLLPAEALRFFPLVPMLARVLAVLLAGNTDLALLVVSNISALGAGMLLYRLTLDETGDRNLATRAAWLIALAPPASALVMGYAEPTMMVLAIAAFFALRRQRWGWAACAGALAGLSRPSGIVLVVPAVIEALRTWNVIPWRERWYRLAAVAAPVAGTLTYLAWVGNRYGDWLSPYRIAQEPRLRGSFTNPIANLVEAGRDLFRGDEFGSGLHLPWALLFLGLLVVTFRRFPASYGAFAAVILATVLTGDNLDSLERYALSAFPLVLAAAVLTRHWLAERVTLLLSVAGLVGYATLIFLGASIP